MQASGLRPSSRCVDPWRRHRIRLGLLRPECLPGCARRAPAVAAVDITGVVAAPASRRTAVSTRRQRERLLTFTNPGYTSSTYVVPVFRQFRCDNKTAGRTDPGCVVPWYASAVYYSQATNPDLASHVSRAQASGLPGATFEAPLTRTTDPAVNQTNRDRACGYAPSVTGKSCDEYPVASSEQGLSAGGTRRTFDGCGFPGIQAGQGPTGVSVCMITASENSSQGGLHSAMYRSERVLQDDPFRVVVIP